MNTRYSRFVLAASCALALTCSARTQIFVDPAPPGNVQSLDVTGFPRPGEPLFFEVSGAAGAPAAVLVANGPGFFALPPLGTLLVDPLGILGTIGSTVGVSTRTVLPFVVPGTLFVTQAVRLNGAALELSNGVRIFIMGGAGARPFLELDAPPLRTTASAERFGGRASFAGSTIQVVGGAAVVTALADQGAAGDGFAVDVPLRSATRNRLFFIETTTTGTQLPPVGWEIVQDAEAPEVFVDAPVDGQLTVEAAITIVGRVADRLSGPEGMRVTVRSGIGLQNVIQASVNPGVGTNGTFEAAAVPLEAVGVSTPIRIIAEDVLGNTATIDLHVRRQAPVGVVIDRLDGDGQSAPIHTTLPTPLRVRVRRPDGIPFANKVVTFAVTRSDGTLQNVQGGTPRRELQVVTDSGGIAAARWTLGSDGGQGNNRVTITSGGALEPVTFCASAAPGPLAQINVSDGNEQTGVVGAALATPLVIWASDACNSVPGVPIVFEVVDGGGLVVSDGSGGPVHATTVVTDQCGHARVQFICGPVVGEQVIVARAAGGQLTDEATFRVKVGGFATNGPTTFRGIVLDNASRPLEAAGVELHIGTLTFGSVTNAEGCFEIAGITAGGPASLHVDGSTIVRVGGAAIGTDRYPDLHYETLVTLGTENSLPRCITLPALKLVNRQQYDPSRDVTLRVDGIEGLEMKIVAGTVMRFANGVNAPAGTAIELNSVHVDDIPMPMTDGAAPPFAWTLQPGGATFEPPIEITYPNMSGLAPGSVSYFLSFDHDTGKFEIIGSGTVSEDGSTIVTDPGSGLRKAGWGCNCPPYSVTTDCDNCVTSCGNRGFINRGGAEPSIPNPRLNDTITFRLRTAPVDTGGTQRVECPRPRGSRTESIPAVPVDVSWRVIAPNGSVVSGFGTETASITLSECGLYRATFTASANRPCPPDTAFMSTTVSPLAAETLQEFTLENLFAVDSVEFVSGLLTIAATVGGCDDPPTGSPTSSYSIEFQRGEACCPGGGTAPYLRGAISNSASGGGDWQTCVRSPPFFIPLGPLASVPFFAEGRFEASWSIQGATVSATFCQPPIVDVGASISGTASADLTLNAGIAEIISVGGGVRFAASAEVDLEGGATFRGTLDGDVAIQGIVTAFLDLPLLPPARYSAGVDLGSRDLGPRVLFEFDPASLLR